MPTIQAEPLRGWVAQVFAASGASAQEAADIAEHLVEANLMGHDSHGVVRTLTYMNQVQNGTIKPGGPIEVIHEHGAAVVIDGNWNFGQVIAKEAMAIAIDRAREHGLSAVVCRQTGHIGRVGAYAQQAAAAGMIGIGCVNNPGTTGLVAPFGGAVGRMGTNPLAIAIPGPDGDRPFVLDFATSVAAEGKMRVAVNKGVEVPPDYLLNSDGQPTRDPRDLYPDEAGKRGALLPFGGPVAYKAYGLAMAVEALSGSLSGAGTAGSGKPGGNGVFLMALDIGSFIDRGEFAESFLGLNEWVTQPPFREGTDEVLTAGEPERRRMAERLANGIDLDDETWRQMMEAGAMFNVAPMAV